ncbi:hypothetical protein LDENG_00047450 [Lucifuga dentata]|nr:hypothetical protein LDENG_00047450 [Lucifuga dentata]
MIVKDAQPFSIVEDVGFKDLAHKLDPTYVLPTRQAVKAMVQKKYEEMKNKAKSDVQKAVAVSLTTAMWTSIHMDAYLAVTCHYAGGKRRTLHYPFGSAAFSKGSHSRKLG